MVRLILAYLGAAGVGVVGALILGEYTFGGVVVLGSGVVLGLFVGEMAIAVSGDGVRARSRHGDVTLGIGCAVIAAAAMAWAAWISTGHDLSFLGPAGWASIVLAGVGAYLRTGWSRRVPGSPAAEPAPAASPEDSPP